MVLSPVQAEHPHSRAIVDRGVLKPLPVSTRHDLDVHLHRVSGTVLLKQLQLLWPTASSLDEVRQAQIAKDPLDGLRRYSNVMDALQPNPRAASTGFMLRP